MRTVLRALSLVFAVGVVAMLTSSASREDSGCSTRSDGLSKEASSPSVKPQSPPASSPTPAQPQLAPKPAVPKPAAPEPTAPQPEIPNRFMGASKSAAIFIPPPPVKQTPKPVPQ